MGSLSPTHWLIIALVVVILFGARRLPDAARGLGRSLRIFRSELGEMHTEDGKRAPDRIDRHGE
ncbi:Sec-independent protein translocase subunit TatA [Nocardia sp. NPDC052254]|uniref:Sec-independent protein translocase subunit TatA n=1 Tax=Nocardia sp. NPDC052254 TaxID=3155681 RepID=UPI0034363890